MSKGSHVAFGLPAFAALALALLFSTGFALALSGPRGAPLTQPRTAPTARALPPRGSGVVVVLGDSISRGTGDPLAGYAARVTNRLRERGRPVQLVNFAIDGSETSDVVRVLDDTQVRDALARSSLVLISAAGNDFSHALRGGRERGLSKPQSPPADTSTALRSARERLEAVVDKVRELAPQAPVRLLGLYNPFEIEPGRELEARRELLQWNTAIEAAALHAPGVLVVPIADLFESRPDRLAADRYHPGATGHAAIAERVLSTLPDAE